MNAQELISSGLLEAYVLGDESPDERLLVERMRQSDEVVRVELDAIERALEEHAVLNAAPPPARVRASVMNRIGAADDNVLPLMPKTNGPTTGFNWLAAASIGALLISSVGNFMLYGELRGVRDRLADLENERAVLAQELQVQRTSLQESRDQLAVVLDPHKRVVPLAPQKIAPDAAARVYWDDLTHEVYVDVLSLPPAPPGKQYQLWAQVGGEMVDAGLFDNASNAPRIQRMKNTITSTAFGVTLENEGGSETPTLTELYLLGVVG